MGSCGPINGGQYIVAWNPGACGQSIGLRAFGRCVQATVMDRCASCGGDHVDMTPALFQWFTGLGVGRFNVDILPGGCGGAPAGGGGTPPPPPPPPAPAPPPPPQQGNKGIGAGCGNDMECSKGCCVGQCMDPCYCPNAHWKNMFCPNGPPQAVKPPVTPAPPVKPAPPVPAPTGIKGNGWKCINIPRQGWLASRVSKGVTSCLSTDAKNCMWRTSQGACRTLINNQPRNQRPQVCKSTRSGWCKVVKDSY